MIIDLFSPEGERKYLIEDERLQFLELARQAENEQRIFCLMLYYTGARIFEVLNMTFGNIDNTGFYVTIESLKKRRKGIFRRIPLPDFFWMNCKWHIILISIRKILRPKTINFGLGQEIQAIVKSWR